MTIQQTIEAKLVEHFNPSHLQVINESHMHNVAEGSESHFKVVIASDKFEGERLIKRHRQVNSILKTELSDHIHALALHTYTSEEWQKQTQGAPSSPNCMGGSAK